MLDLKEALPEILKVTDVWPEFLDAITTELTYLQTEMEEKINYFNVDAYTDKEALLDFCRSLGYSPNLLLDDSLDYVKKEANDIIFKIRNKAIYYYYNYVFRNIDETGNIYIFFRDSDKLIRAADETAILSSFDTHNLSTPFTSFNEILHFSEYIENLIQLDDTPLYYLDGSPLWYLDQDIVVKPTNHLSLEYVVDELITESGTEYIITPNYLQFLMKMASYGRKATQVPHIGAQITFMMDESGYFDNISGSTYSIPTIKTNCTTTSAYDPTETNSLAQFYKMVVGTSSKTMVDVANGSILNDVDLWYPFDNVVSNAMEDLSGTYEASVAGSFVETTGSIGKTISLNGLDTEVSTDNYIFDQADKSINFWVRGDILGQSYSQPRMVYMNSVLNVYYDSTLQKISATLIGGSGSATVEYSVNLTNTEKNICLTINDSGNLMNLYINGVLEDFADTSSIGTWGDTTSFHIGSQNGSNYFKGYIDEFRVYNKILSESERNYIYNSRPGALVRLANPIYEEILSDNQLIENEDWVCSFGAIPAGSIENEVIASGDGITNTFSGYTAYNQLALASLEFTYTSSPTLYTATTDKFGNIEGDRVNGTINFTTGYYTLNTYERTLRRNETVYSGATSSIIGYTTGFGNVEANTFHLYVYFADTLSDITDDGNGNLVGTGLTSGTINYTTGAINATFSGTSDSGVDITCKYYYRRYSTPDENTTIYASYKTNQDIQFTEAGIANQNDDIVAYATFPPAKFYSVLNHLSLQFVVHKTES